MDGMAPRDDKKNGLGCGVCLIVVVVAEQRGLSRSSGWGSPCQDARESSSGARTLIDFPTPPASPRVLASKVYTPI